MSRCKTFQLSNLVGYSRDWVTVGVVYGCLLWHAWTQPYYSTSAKKNLKYSKERSAVCSASPINVCSSSWYNNMGEIACAWLRRTYLQLLIALLVAPRAGGRLRRGARPLGGGRGLQTFLRGGAEEGAADQNYPSSLALKGGLGEGKLWFQYPGRLSSLAL